MNLSRRRLIAASAALAIFPSASRAGKPQRVVSLGGDLTEILCALGESKILAGRDATSYFPPEVTKLPDVGYLRTLGAEGILSLKPDLVLAAASAGPPETLRQIEGAGVRVVKAPEIYAPEAAVEKIRLIGKAASVEEAGERLAGEVSAAITRSQAEIAALTGEPRALFVLNARDGSPMAAGSGTAADAMLTLGRAANVFNSHSGYKAISLEAAVAAAPDAIVMMDRTLTALGGVEAVVQHPALRLTPAAKEKRIIARDSLFLLGFGPRLPAAMADLARALRQAPA